MAAAREKLDIPALSSAGAWALGRVRARGGAAALSVGVGCAASGTPGHHTLAQRGTRHELRALMAASRPARVATPRAARAPPCPRRPPPSFHPDRCLLVAPDGTPPRERPTIAPPPPSALAARLAAFLPELAAANAALDAAVAAGQGDEFNVEAVTEGGAHVAMEVACGVVDLQDSAALAAAEAALAKGGGGGGGVEDINASPSSASSESSDDGDDEPAAAAATRSAPKRARLAPGIKLLD